MITKKIIVGILSGAILTVGNTLATSTAAETITLNANDGSISVSGEFVDYVDGNYKILTTLGELVLSADTVTCEGLGCPDLTPAIVAADVVFAGSDTVGEGLMPLMLAGYATHIEGALDISTADDGTTIYHLIGDDGYGEAVGSFSVNSTGSSDAFTALGDSSASVGMSSRRIRREEARALSQAGAGLMTELSQEHIIAVDSLVTIINQSNPVNSISIANLASVYKGEITNWKQLGGNDERIVVYSRTASSGTRAVFENRIFGQATARLVARIVSNNETMAARVNSNPAAIGFVGYAYTNGAKGLNLISECGITTSADAFSAKTEEYPLQRRLYLYNRSDNLSAIAENFLNYAKSDAADGLVAKAGFINLGVERVLQDNSQTRMRDLIKNTTDQFELALMRELLVEMFQWDRLSTTFRFASGSNQLERKSILDLIRLVDYLSDQPAGTEVALVGFTDSDGAFSANRALGVRRAQQAITAVNDFAGNQLSHINFTALGFGELAPAACNDSLNGKRINRRVEVWIRSES
ncbi:MAG: phosphate ABC transporter substrate-binding/OmpA family protein [Paracoccaceae bacterium]